MSIWVAQCAAMKSFLRVLAATCAEPWRLEVSGWQLTKSFVIPLISDVAPGGAAAAAP